ncbi:hypothetical protein BH10PSE14_BH10PSE14_30590 [soil metagenome]
MLSLAITLMLAVTQQHPISNEVGSWTEIELGKRSRAEIAADDLYDCYISEMNVRGVNLDSSAARIRRLDLAAARFCATELRVYRQRRGARAASSAFRRIFDDYWSRL